MKAGSLEVDLILNGDKFTVTVKDSERMLQQLSKQFDQTGDAVKRIDKHFDSVATKFRHFVTTIGMMKFALMDLYGAFLALPANILKTTGELERMFVMMQGLSKETDNLGKSMEAMKNRNAIFEMARNAPFEIKTLTDAFIKFQNAGLDPLAGGMQALVDSVAKFGGTSETLHRAAVAIQQMGGKGVISMEELRQQLGEAVPSAMRAMATGMGLSMGDLVKHISKGEVEASDALRRMLYVMRFENEGAAKRMMETWVGSLSRLDTEWTLFQEKIGNSGFSQAMTKAVQDLTKSLSSPEMSAFAVNLGKSLGDLVTIFAQMGQRIAELWPYIKTTGEAILYYFAATKIANWGDAMRQNFIKYRAEMDITKAKQAEVVAANLARVQQENAQERSRLSQIQIRNQEEVAAAQAKYRALLAEHAAYQRQIMALEATRRAQIDASRLGTVGSLLGGSSPGAVSALTREIRAVRDKDEALKKVIETERTHQTLLQTGLIASANTVNAFNRKALAAENLASKVTMAMRAAQAGSFVLTAMGGWLGVVTTVLTIGALAWSKWGNDGEKAISKVRNAINQGFATQEDVKAIDSQVKEREEKLATIQKKLEAAQKGAAVLRELAKTNPSAKGAASDADARVANLRSQYEEQTRELVRLGEDRNKALSQVERRAVEERAANWQREIEQTKEARKAQAQAEVASIVASVEEKKRAGQLSGAALAKAQEEAQKQQVAVMQRFEKDEYDRLLSQRKKLTEDIALIEGDSSMRKSDPLVLNEAYEKLKRINSEIASQATVIKDAQNISMPWTKVAGKDEGNGTGTRLDPLNTALERARGELSAARERLDDLQDGAISFDRIFNATVDKFYSEARAGKFDKIEGSGKNRKRIPFLDDAGNIPVARLQEALELIDSMTEKEDLLRSRRGLAEINKLNTSATEEYASALQRLNQEGESADSAFLNLNKTLARLRTTLSDRGAAGIQFDKKAQELRGVQAATSLLNLTADLQGKNRQIAAGTITDDRQRREFEYQEESKHLRRMFDIRVQNLVAAKGESARNSDEVIAAQEEFYRHMELRAQRHIIEMRTPLQQLAEEWSNTQQQMQNATRDWAGDIINELVDSAKTGRFEFKKVLEKILLDISRMQLQKQLAGPLTKGLEEVGNWLTKNLFGSFKEKLSVFDLEDKASGIAMGGKDIAMQTATDTAASGLTTLGTSFTAMSKTTTVLDSVMAALKLAATAASEALSTLAATANGGSGSGLLGSLGGGLADLFTGGGDGVDVVMSDIPLPFAQGGIMGANGAMSLRRYANGGIANRPQLAMFGEGDDPEAYVPLPDGRSIPVTMRNAQPNINVNVINQTGQPVDATHGQPRIEGDRLVLDVVLSAVSRPGPFRDGMKQAMGV